MAVTLDKFPIEKLPNSNNAYISHQNQESFPSTDQTTNILKESYQKSNKIKEVYVEKLELTNEDLGSSPSKSNNNYLFEFGKKKIKSLIKTLETSKSTNFEDRVNSLKNKYEITDQEDNIFIIPEQHNEIDENNIKKEIKETFNLKFLHNKVKSLMAKPASANNNEKDEKNWNLKEQLNENTRKENKSDSNLIKNFSLLINKGLIIKNKESNQKKSLENIENRMSELEKEVIFLKSQNKKLISDNKELSEKMEAILTAKKEENMEYELRINELEHYIDRNKDNFEKIKSLLKISLDDSGLLNKTETKPIKNERKCDLKVKASTKESERKNRKSILETNPKKTETIVVKQMKKTEAKYTKSMSHFFDKTHFVLDSDNSGSTKNSNINPPALPGGKKVFFTPKGVFF